MDALRLSTLQPRETPRRHRSHSRCARRVRLRRTGARELAPIGAIGWAWCATRAPYGSRTGARFCAAPRPRARGLPDRGEVLVDALRLSTLQPRETPRRHRSHSRCARRVRLRRTGARELAPIGAIGWAWCATRAPYGSRTGARFCAAPRPRARGLPDRGEVLVDALRLSTLRPRETPRWHQPSDRARRPVPTAPAETAR